MTPLIYYTSFFLIFFLLIFVARTNRQLEATCKTPVWLLLTLFSGLRVGLGRDYFVYINAYTDPLHPSALVLEPFWQSFNWFCRDILHMSTHMWFALISGATYAFVLWGFKRWRIDWTLGILFFVLIYKGYFESLNTVRQCLATAVGFVGVSFLMERKHWQFLTTVIIASVLHFSALILLFMYPLMAIRWRWQWLVLIWGVSLLIGTVLLQDLVALVAHVVPQRYEVYLDIGDFTTDRTTGLYQIFLGLLAFLAIAYVHYRTSNKTAGVGDNRGRALALMVITSICIYNIFSSYEPALRLMLYFFCAIYGFIVCILSEKRWSIWYYGGMFIVLGFTAFMLKNITDPQEGYSKYQTIFERTMPEGRIKQLSEQ